MKSWRHDPPRMLDSGVWFYTVMLVILCLLCGVASRGTAQDGAPAAGEAGLGHWMTGASAPTARTEVAVAVLDGLIYVVGGFEQPGSWIFRQSSASTKVEVYDPATNRWSSRPDLPWGCITPAPRCSTERCTSPADLPYRMTRCGILPTGCFVSIRLMKHGPTGLRYPRLAGDWP